MNTAMIAIRMAAKISPQVQRSVSLSAWRSALGLGLGHLDLDILVGTEARIGAKIEDIRLQPAATVAQGAADLGVRLARLLDVTLGQLDLRRGIARQRREHQRAQPRKNQPVA